MEEIFARRKARLMELRARRKGEDGEPKRLAARAARTAAWPISSRSWGVRAREGDSSISF